MALVWLFGLGGLGVWFPFISLYLDENLGLSGIQLGMAIAGLALFSSALIPIYVSVTLALTRDGDPGSFGLMRMRGTIGVLIAVVGFPVLLDAHQAGSGLVANPEAGLSEPGLEIMFPVAGATLERVGARGLLAIGVVAGGVRWIVCGLASDLAWVYPVAVLHGLVV